MEAIDLVLLRQDPGAHSQRAEFSMSVPVSGEVSPISSASAAEGLAGSAVLLIFTGGNREFTYSEILHLITLIF